MYFHYLFIFFFVDDLIVDQEQSFGNSRLFNESLKSLVQKDINEERIMISNATIEEAKSLATCTFEQNTKWGKDVSLMECIHIHTYIHIRVCKIEFG